MINAFLMCWILLWYTCVTVRLKALYMKHYNNTQPNLIMCYSSQSIPHSPLHSHVHAHALTQIWTRTHKHTPTHTNTLSSNLFIPSFPAPPRIITSQSLKWSAAKRNKQQNPGAAYNACERVRVAGRSKENGFKRSLTVRENCSVGREQAGFSK